MRVTVKLYKMLIILDETNICSSVELITFIVSMCVSKNQQSLANCDVKHLKKNGNREQRLTKSHNGIRHMT